MTTIERVRALIGNLKHHPWDIYPTFKIEKEDAEALREYLQDDPDVTVVVKNEE